ncbi:nuclear envelope integral membrane protein 2 isoform X1 [Pogona vitticeps]
MFRPRGRRPLPPVPPRTRPQAFPHERLHRAGGPRENRLLHHFLLLLPLPLPAGPASRAPIQAALDSRPPLRARLLRQSNGCLAPRLGAVFKPAPEEMPPRAGAPQLRLWLGLLPLLAWGVRAGVGDGELALREDYNCRYLKVMDIMRSSEPSCFCYLPNGSLHLKNIWTTIQVKINSIEPVEVVSISEERNCHQSENLFAFLKCLLNNLWQPRVSKETVISVAYYGDKTCLRVQPTNKMPYTVSVQQNMLDEKLLLLFVAGGLLFHFARNLSRSVIFYYSAGVAFGVFATLIFLLLMLKRFIPKLSTFWILMSGCWFSSLYFFYILKEDLKWLWYNSAHYILGYVLTVGLFSFTACYLHGPLHSVQSMNILMWLLQLLGLVFVYFGIAIPQVAYVIIATMLFSKILQYLLQIVCYLGRKATRFFKSEKIKIRHLTEEEFREQGETETARALEELRRFCSRPEFPSWVAVVKLQTPQKFANFVLGLPHVSPEEVTAHDELYGLGGAILEEQLFNTENKTEPDQLIGLTEAEENHEEESEGPAQQNSLHFHGREFL